MSGQSGSIEVIPLKLGMTRAFIIRHDGVMLVDTGYPGSGEAILAAMEEHGIRPHELRLILLTHGHGDHAGSAALLREKTGAPVAVHRNDAGKVREGVQGCLKPTGLTGRILGPVMGRDASFPPCEPDILIGDEMPLHEYGIPGLVVATPGHTPGSVSVVLSSGDALAGDLIFPQIPSGRPGLPFWADDPDEVRQSIRKLLGYQPSRIYLAHGEVQPAGKIRIPER